MNLEDIRIADDVFRVYYNAYKNNQMVGTEEVKENLNIANQQFQEALLYIEAEDFIEINNKGFGTGAVYKLTKRGFSFFSKTTLEKHLTKNEDVQPTTTNIFNGDINESNFQVGDKNNQTNSNEHKKDYLKEIVIGIVIVLIGGYLVYMLGWN
jgi:hypothetical protein